MKTGLYKLKERLYIEKNGYFLIKTKTWRTYIFYYKYIMVLNSKVILRNKKIPYDTIIDNKGKKYIKIKGSN